MSNATSTQSLIKVLKVERNDRPEPKYGRDYARNFKEFSSKPRVYFSVEGETILENLVERHGRPYKAYRQVLAAALESIGMDVSELKFNWSKFAGCSMCPCSPGFVVSSKDGGRPQGRYDIWITVGADEDAVQDAEKRAVVKAAQLKINGLKADLGIVTSEAAKVALRAAINEAIAERNAA